MVQTHEVADGGVEELDDAGAFFKVASVEAFEDFDNEFVARKRVIYPDE